MTFVKNFKTTVQLNEEAKKQNKLAMFSLVTQINMCLCIVSMQTGE